MFVEIDENKLVEMQEDIENYIKLIKILDDSIAIKNDLINKYEHELNISKEIIVNLLNSLIAKGNLDEETVKTLNEIIFFIENDDVPAEE